jgi:hypothetical protein
MCIIKRANKLTNPPKLTRETGFVDETVYDCVKDAFVTKTIPTWCHSKAYFILRGSETRRIAQDTSTSVQSLTKSDGHSAALRSMEANIKNFTEMEREIVLRLLGE